MRYVTILLFLMSCTTANYRRSTGDCSKGEWQVFYNPYGHPVKRKITDEELEGKKLWVDRVESYQADYNDLKITINRDGQIFKGQKKLHKIENLNHLETKSFKLYSNDNSFLILHSKNEHAKKPHLKKVYYFAENDDLKTVELMKLNAGIVKLKTLKLNTHRDFTKILQVNPKSGERYLSEYAPLSYQCEKN